MAFRNVLLSTFCYHLYGDGSDREDCRGGIKLSHFWANSLAISWILATAAVAVLSAALWAARRCISPSDPFERVMRRTHPWCASFEDVQARVASKQAAPP